MGSKAKDMIYGKGKSSSSRALAVVSEKETASDKIRKFFGAEKDAKLKKVKKDHNLS